MHLLLVLINGGNYMHTGAQHLAEHKRPPYFLTVVLCFTFLKYLPNETKH